MKRPRINSAVTATSSNRTRIKTRVKTMFTSTDFSRFNYEIQPQHTDAI